MKSILSSPLTAHRSPLTAHRSPLVSLIAFMAAVFFTTALIAQGSELPAYDPCAPSPTLSIHCLDGTRKCDYYSQFPCSPDYCWTNVVIGDNEGIPVNGVVENKVIEIADTYTITRKVTFENCLFKMHGGARINISPVNPLLGGVIATFRNCDFFGCSEMWQGIYVNAANAPNMMFFFNNCSVEDAYIGLQLDEAGGKYSIADNSFRNNHIGIGNLRQNGSALNASIIRNTFSQSADLAARLDSLAPPFPMPDYPIAHAGIKYVNTSTSVGIEVKPLLPVLNTGNTFSCLMNGLISENSNVASARNTFQNMGQYGIWATGGTLRTEHCKFLLEGHTGIWASGTNLTAILNRFEGDWVEGIYSAGDTNSEWIAIAGNEFTIAAPNWTRGIFVFRPQSATGLYVWIGRNIFTVTSCSAFGLDCIYVIDVADSAGALWITSNNLTINYAGGPIDGIIVSMGSSDNCRIALNNIHYGILSNSGVLNFGINLSKNGAQALSVENIVKNNTITGIQTNFLVGSSVNCGFHVWGGLSNTDFCDNTVDQSRWGFHFHDNNDVRLRENHINHHDYGLYIQGATGPQFGRGNQWNLDPNACRYAARNESAIPLSSQFLVDEDEEGVVLPWLPPAAKIFPVPNPMAPATYWFHKDDVPLDHCVPEGEISLPRALTQYEKEAVAGTSPLSGAEHWNLKLDAYTKLLIFSSLRPAGSPEEAFFNSLGSTALASLAQVTAQVRSALAISAADQSAFYTYRTAIQQAFDSLAVLDQSMDYSSQSNLTEAWFEQRAALLQQVATNAASEAALENTRNQQLGTALQNILVFNAGISTAQAYESARKTLHELRIRHLLGEPMTQALYQQALSLAQQNPAITGYATEEVLIYLAPCDQHLYRDADEAPQERSEALKPHSSTGAVSLQIAPNPTGGLFEVEIPHHHGASLAVHNVQGKVVMAQSVEPGIPRVTMDMRQYPAGLYWVVLTDPTGAILGKAKVSVSH
ncbi:MAG: T9SS type A sorting domain-containing protein [Saprospiraceae bacterium]